MLLIFPFLVWLAPAVSLAMMLMLSSAGELRARALALALAWFLIAAYCQFLGPSAIVAAAGVALQTMLAIGLIVRWRFTAP